MNRSILLATLFATGLSACATVNDDGDAGPAGAAAAELRDVSGRPVGTASVTQTGDALRVRIVSRTIASGAHGAHLHDVGACETPDFSSAGPHWNPTARQHGSENPRGPHLGDMPNLLVGTDGQGVLEFTIPASRLERGDRALLDGDGAAVVIHSAADDHRTDPSGNSGARIACGVLVPVVVR